MTGTGRVRAYVACSLDGFIAGPDGDLSWLPGDDDFTTSASDPAGEADALDYETFIADVGAILMGRATYDTVLGFGIPWPYGDLPVLVATTRPLEAPATTVRAVGGEIGALIGEASRAAGDADVYIDGGDLIRQALGAGLLDEITITWVPVVLGDGHTLFAGCTHRHRLLFSAVTPYGPGLAQVRAVPAVD